MFISFLGIGQAGGNIAELASKNGFYSGAINYSQRDLDSLTHIENKIQLIGSEGVGKDRKIAISLMNSNWDLATNFVKENFSHPSIELIFVPFSTGGGSGSGISPLLINLLTEIMPDKTFVAMPIIPDTTETYTNQSNCLDTFEDLSQLDIAVLPIDNEQIRTATSNAGRIGLYRNTNEKVIQLIKDIVAYTDKHSQYSVLDRKDLLNIFKTKGYASISEINIASLSDTFELSESSFAQKIQESWNQSPFAKVEFNKITSAGIIFDGQERLINCLNMNKIFSVFENKMPISLFEGMYENEKGRVISILSGLSICRSRLNQIECIIEENKQSFNSISNSNDYKSKVNKINLNQNNQPKKQPTVKDISAMINKFRR